MNGPNEPPTAATKVLPLAEAATQPQLVIGALVCIQACAKMRLMRMNQAAQNWHSDQEALCFHCLRRKDNPNRPARTKNRGLGSGMVVTTQVPMTDSPIGLPRKKPLLLA